MGFRFFRKQRRGVVQMGHFPAGVRDGDAALTSFFFNIAKQTDTTSVFDDGGPNQRNILNRGQLILKYDDADTPAWAAQSRYPTPDGFTTRTICRALVPLSDGGCIAIYEALSGNTTATWDLGNGDGTVFATMAIGNVDEDRRVGTFPFTSWVVRHDANGTVLWAKRQGTDPDTASAGQTMDVPRPSLIFLQVDESGEHVFVEQTFNGGLTVTNGEGEANEQTYTLPFGGAWFPTRTSLLTYNLSTGLYLDYQVIRANTEGNATRPFSNGGFYRASLNGEMLYSFTQLSPTAVWFPSSAAHDMLIGERTTAPVIYTPFSIASSSLNDNGWTSIFAHSSDAEAGPDYILEARVRRDGAAFSSFVDSASLVGPTKFVGSLLCQLPDAALTNLSLVVRDATPAVTTKQVLTLATTAPFQGFIFVVDKDGISNFVSQHWHKLAGASTSNGQMNLLYLDEARDLLVCSYDPLNIQTGTSTLRVNTGAGDQTDLPCGGATTPLGAFEVTKIIFYRLSTLAFLGSIRYANQVNAINPRNPAVRGSELILNHEFQRDTTVVPTRGAMMDIGGPNEEFVDFPAGAAVNDVVFGFSRINLDTLTHVPGSYRDVMVVDAAGLPFSNFTFGVS